MRETESNKDFSVSFDDAYSFSRVSSMYWSAFANKLIDIGYSEAAAKQWIFSKAARWMLDANEREVEELAKQMADKFAVSYASIEKCEEWAKEEDETI